MSVLYSRKGQWSRGAEKTFQVFSPLSRFVALILCALAEVFPDEELVIAVVSQEVGTAMDFRIAVILAVLIPCGENVCFTDGLVRDAHDCGNHVGFGVDPVFGKAPDSLEEEAIIEDLTVAGADEVELVILVGCHACIVTEWGVDARGCKGKILRISKKVRPPPRSVLTVYGKRI